jgi:hypothetical protein
MCSVALTAIFEDPLNPLAELRGSRGSSSASSKTVFRECSKRMDCTDRDSRLGLARAVLFPLG